MATLRALIAVAGSLAGILGLFLAHGATAMAWLSATVDWLLANPGAFLYIPGFGALFGVLALTAWEWWRDRHARRRREIALIAQQIARDENVAPLVRAYSKVDDLERRVAELESRLS